MTMVDNGRISYSRISYLILLQFLLDQSESEVGTTREQTNFHSFGSIWLLNQQIKPPPILQKIPKLWINEWKFQISRFR